MSVSRRRVYRKRTPKRKVTRRKAPVSKRRVYRRRTPKRTPRKRVYKRKTSVKRVIKQKTLVNKNKNSINNLTGLLDSNAKGYLLQWIEYVDPWHYSYYVMYETSKKLADELVMNLPYELIIKMIEYLGTFISGKYALYLIKRRELINPNDSILNNQAFINKLIEIGVGIWSGYIDEGQFKDKHKHSYYLILDYLKQRGVTTEYVQNVLDNSKYFKNYLLVIKRGFLHREYKNVEEYMNVIRKIYPDLKTPAYAL